MAKRKADSSFISGEARGNRSKRFDDGSAFRSGLFDQKTLQSCRNQYAKSTPYRHGVIDSLIDDQLLRAVRDEIRSSISFTPKETDIYKIHQSGDLANLDGLDNESLSQLPSLIELRDALYGDRFRKFLSAVTGSGHLSGKKTDMAVNVYTPGCHLLCHDDVIGSRRVSYILYLTDPDLPWKAEWGGALRLFPTENVPMGGDASKKFRLPHPDHCVEIPPAFNQLSFFAVQPGESFHDVEEVYARPAINQSEEDGGRIRMAISGWFHIPQEGEEGYVEGAEEQLAEQSSLAQLQGKAVDLDLPKPEWTAYNETISAEQPEQDTELSEHDLSFLIKFMNPQYLTPDAVEELADAFLENSALRLGDFLSKSFADALKAAIEGNEKQGNAQWKDWKVARPPHKHRYLFSQRGQHFATNPLLSKLLNDFIPSLPFRKWVALATSLDLAESDVLIRRYRRGLDYSLATSYDDEEPQLEFCLGLTPSGGWDEDEGDGEEDDDDEEDKSTRITEAEYGTSSKNPNEGAPGVPEGGVGGYEMYMAGDDIDGEDDDASDHGVIIPPSSHTGAGKRKGKSDPAIYKAAGEDEDDGILFYAPASWNTVNIILRDQGTLKFTKYVSRSAQGDRWDCSAIWKIDSSASNNDDDDDDDIEAES